MLNACGHMYLDQGEELNLSRNLNNYLNLASQMVQQVLVHVLRLNYKQETGSPG